jgi:hypothetical protein
MNDASRWLWASNACQAIVLATIAWSAYTDRPVTWVWLWTFYSANAGAWFCAVQIVRCTVRKDA